MQRALTLRIHPFFIALLILFLSSESLGKNPARSKVIDFEDEVIEALHKKPLDSLSQISEAERRRRQMHLYKKRAGFKDENTQSIREMRYIQ